MNIDSIFYFCKNENEYRTALQQGDIAPQTIVFVESTREIYLNGYGYGKTSTKGLLSDDEYNAWKDLIEDQIETIINNADNANQELIDQWTRDLQYLSDRLTNKITEVNNRLTDVQNTLQGQIDTIGSSIANDVSGQLDTYSDLIDGHDTRITALEGDVVQIRRSYVATNNATWADFILSYDNIKTQVNKVSQFTDDNGNIKYTAIQSLIQQGIDNDTAITSIKNYYAEVGQYKDVLKWLASGFTSAASETNSFAEMYAAALDDKLDSSAISTIKTSVIEDINGLYATKAELSSLQANGFIFKPTSESPADTPRVITTGISLPEFNKKYSLHDIQQMLGSDYSKILDITPENGSYGAFAIFTPGVAYPTTAEVKVANLTVADMSTEAYTDKAITQMSVKYDNSLASISATVGENSSAIEQVTTFDGNSTYTINESKLNAALVALLAESGQDITGLNAKSMIQAMATTGQSTIDLATSVEDNRTDGVAVSGLNLGSYIDQNGGRSAGFALAADVFDEAKYTVSKNANSAANFTEGTLYTKSQIFSEIRRAYPSLDTTSIEEGWELVAEGETYAFMIPSDGVSYTITLRKAKAVKGYTQLKGTVDEHTATLSGLATWKEGVVNNTAGYVTAAGAENAVASFFARSDDADKTTAVAQIIAEVNKEGSNISIDADRIYLEGTTLAEALVASQVNVGDWEISGGYLVGDSGDLGNSTVGYVRNVINLTPEALVFTNTIKSTTQDTDADDTINRLTIDPVQGITIDKHIPQTPIEQYQDPSVQIKTDGSGFVANGNIEWDRNGSLIVRNANLVAAHHSVKVFHSKEYTISNSVATGKDTEYLMYEWSDVSVPDTNKGYYKHPVDLHLKCDHLFIAALGAQASSASSVSGESKLTIKLPPAHNFVGQRIIITNQTVGYQNANIKIAQDYYRMLDGTTQGSDNVLVLTDNSFMGGEEYDGTVLSLNSDEEGVPYADIQSLTEEPSFEKIFRTSGLWEMYSGGSYASNSYAYLSEIKTEIEIGQYEWVELTAVEGIFKDVTYTSNHAAQTAKALNYNAVWMLSRWEKKVQTT